MCGIAGIVHFNRTPDVSIRLARMSEAIAHRGPDATGDYTDACVSLAHRRLSIIDPVPTADQPMQDANNQYVIIFNGEIYNYRELRNQLNDYPYRTEVDTEVILAAWTKWGIDAVNKLDGIFAFALWDKKNETLWLVRDKMGVKPLYYSDGDEAFCFSSELRSLIAGGLISNEIDLKGISSFLHYHSVGYGNSLLKGVSHLEAGSWLKLTQYGKEIKSYYRLDNELKHPSLDRTAIHQDVFDILIRSTQKRLMSDVPLGVFLSGGVDSSAIVALMSLVSSKPLHTFTLSMDESDREDEQYAELVSKSYRTEHQSIRLDEQDVLELIMKGVLAMDSPTADGLNTYVISSAVRASGIKVALSGMGADELFAGYPGFRVFQLLMKSKSIFDLSYPLRKTISYGLNPFVGQNYFKWNDLLTMRAVNVNQFYASFRKTTAASQVNDWMMGDIPNPSTAANHKAYSDNPLDACGQYSLAELRGYAQSTLLKDADQMGMAVGLEIREPYFDPELWEYMLSVPESFKLTSRPKQLLTDSLSPLLPSPLLNRRKKGFVLPWKKWMQQELKTFCEKEIVEFSQRSAVNGNAIIRDWDSFVKNHSSIKWIQIWQLVVLNTWLKKMQLDI